MRQSTFYFCMILILMGATPTAARDMVQCTADDTKCLKGMIASQTATIEEPRWRDAAYRDLAVSMAFEGNTDGAVQFIPRINSPDTQAMTIRAIGMALAIHKDLPVAEYRALFQKLDQAAAQITHEGARDIAYTYIAMAQAFAGLDEDATKTTEAMAKPELKNKAFGETAEIQAERGNVKAAMKSLDLIESVAFKNKALAKVSDILVRQGDYANALSLAQTITNPTSQVKALQQIVDVQIGLESYDKQ